MSTVDGLTLSKREEEVVREYRASQQREAGFEMAKIAFRSMLEKYYIKNDNNGKGDYISLDQMKISHLFADIKNLRMP